MTSADLSPRSVGAAGETAENVGARLSRILTAADEETNEVAGAACLEELCRFAGTDRGFIALFDDDECLEHAWLWDESGRPLAFPKPGTPLDELSGSMAGFMRVGRALAVGDLESLELGPSERALVESNGGMPRAGMMLPVLLGGRLLGVVSVHSMDETREWTKATIDQMEAFGELVVRMLDRNRERQALAAATTRARRIAAHLPDGLVMLSTDGLINWVSPSFEAMSSFSAEELEHRQFVELVGPSDRERLLKQFALVVAGPDASIAVRIANAAGDWRWADLSLTLASEPHQGVPDEIVITVRDTHERHMREQRLVEESDRDPLTGLANRGAFDRFIAELAGSDAPVMVAFCDIDDFKSFNDARGHDDGDHILRSVAGASGRSVRARDMVARIGGAEFVVVVVEPGHDAARLGDRLVSAIRAIAAEGRGEPTMSIGVCGPAPGAAAREMVRLADEAMYAAKRAGKDRLVHRGPPSGSWSDLLGP